MSHTMLPADNMSDTMLSTTMSATLLPTEMLFTLLPSSMLSATAVLPT